MGLWCSTCHGSLTLDHPDPLVCVPVLYFIGYQGLPLEVVGGVVSVDDLVTKASLAFEVSNRELQYPCTIHL